MRKARAMPAISPFRTTTAAASFAASVPEPNEIPRSAEARASASLVPSPAMATRPGTVPMREEMRAALASGLTPAWTRVMPSWVATTRAASG
jgi:hypothetical protein